MVGKILHIFNLVLYLRLDEIDLNAQTFFKIKQGKNIIR